MFLSEVIGAIVQAALFTLIPFICWAVTARKKEKFFSYIGLKRPEVKEKKRFIFEIILVVVLCFAVGEIATLLKGSVETADSAYKGLGMTAIPTVLVYAFIRTALAEEILFRGFLLKRLSAKFGFNAGNIIQATIFGLLHLLMVWGQTDFLAGFVMVVYPMLTAVLISYLNEKRANGSILPSIFIHGTINSIVCIIAAMQ